MFNWSGDILVNGNKVDGLDFSSLEVPFKVELKHKAVEKATISTFDEEDADVYKVVVRQYMTKRATPDFDFMEKWNHNNPMPLRTMVGKVVKETKGMVYMDLWGDILTTQTTHCMKCGKRITNPVSQYFGMGPECGSHAYINPFETDEELHNAIEVYRQEYLNKITWSGWIIKSALDEFEKL